MSPPIFATTVRRAAFPAIPHTSRIVAFGAQKRYASTFYRYIEGVFDLIYQNNLDSTQGISYNNFVF